MATLKQLSTGTEFDLFPGFLVGRSTRNTSLQLDDRQVSSVHASFEWDGNLWVIHDLGATNGTFIDGKRMEPSTRRKLAEGARLAFGVPDEIFVLIDSSQPEPMARTEGREPVLGELGVLALSSNDSDQLVLIRAPDGKNWLAEGLDSQPRPVRTGDTLECHGHTYTLMLPARLEPTLDRAGMMTIAGLGLRIRDHGDGIKPEVRLVRGTQLTKLKTRRHNRMILELARNRWEDQADPKMSEPDHGWMDVEELCALCEISDSQLSVWLHRARQQFMDAGLLDSEPLFERRDSPATDTRKRVRQIRIGAADLEIE